MHIMITSAELYTLIHANFGDTDPFSKQRESLKLMNKFPVLTVICEFSESDENLHIWLYLIVYFYFF